MVPKIKTAEFKNRLAVLCLSGGGRGFPRKHRDQHILFKSMVLIFETKQNYAETEVNEYLTKWLNHVGRNLDIDHVSLRRGLVDGGYLIRDSAGTRYRVDTAQTNELFEAEIEGLDPVVVVAAPYQEAEERKQAYLEKGDGD